MIVAKTRIKKIPDTCKKCALSYIPRGTNERVCVVTQICCPSETRPSGNKAYCRPRWCPLIELKEGATNEL